MIFPKHRCGRISTSKVPVFCGFARSRTADHGNTRRRSPPVVFVLQRHTIAGVDVVLARRALLKTSLRRDGLCCLNLREENHFSERKAESGT